MRNKKEGQRKYKLVAPYIQDCYGISLNNARNLVRCIWKLPEDQQDFLWGYTLLRWQKNYFLTQLSDTGTIRDSSGRTYSVIYHRCSPLDIKNADLLWLSFRVWQSDLKQPNIVLVKPAGMNRGDH